MLLRRRMMGQGGEPPTPSTGLGEFGAGYSATLTPVLDESQWTITHNLGAVPEVVIVEMVGEPTLTNYTVNAAYSFGITGMKEQNNGYSGCMYHYNGSDTKMGVVLFSGTTTISADAQTVTLGAMYNSTRSPWDSGTTYHVQVYSTQGDGGTIGDLTQYAKVEVTPDSNQNLLTCANPLGVLPKLVRVASGDRESAAPIYGYTCVPAFCVEGHVLSGNDRANYGTPVAGTPGNYREFRFTDSTIEIFRPASGSKWTADKTYTVHIYA